MYINEYQTNIINKIYEIRDFFNYNILNDYQLLLLLLYISYKLDNSMLQHEINIALQKVVENSSFKLENYKLTNFKIEEHESYRKIVYYFYNKIISNKEKINNEDIVFLFNLVLSFFKYYNLDIIKLNEFNNIK